MKKDLAIIFGLFLLVAALIVFGQGYTSSSFFGTGSGGTLQSSQKPNDRATVAIGDMVIDTKVVSKAGDRKKGLSKIDSLPFTEGMIFVFENKGPYAFWMKDMKFAIDIIWIDENKRVVDIAANVAPEPGRGDDELTLYRPGGEALYVLEINAGLSALHGIQIGDQANFQL